MTVFSDLKTFPRAIRIGDTIYVGGHIASDADGEIGAQTAEAFGGLAATLECAGAGMSDLVNLRTYYLYHGEDGPAVTEYWNRMTEVRLETLADPGPAATAVRVSGVPGPTNLIGAEGVGVLNPDRQRIMPDHAWDWTIPTPFSQGWRVGDKIYVGGQISADRSGKALAVDDIAAQTNHVLDYIRHVLIDGGQDWSDIVTMRICYRHDENAGAAHSRLAAILEVMRETIAEPWPTITVFGVDLLYEGLLLEIDAVARKGGKQVIAPAGANYWVAPEGFATACLAGIELYIGGLSAPGGASLEAQVEATLGRMLDVLGEAGFDAGELVKLTLFHVPDKSPLHAAANRALILRLARAYLPSPGPVVTLLSVPGLPYDGQMFQLDGVAAHGDDRTIISAEEE